ncbi:MAG: 5-oxoprolinase (ATP-hydrolyzing) [Hyphomicrobiaceae bacterium]|jgi:5-oxoprolinase (ATP-hydrolysing)
MTSKIRLSADIGGTFTDIALDAAGQRHTTKILTSTAAPEEALVEGARTVLAAAGLEFSDLDQIIHGTTLATNAIIERKGARTALIASDGFRDTLDIADESRFDQYDVLIEKPRPLVPRELRLTVPERIDVTGKIQTPLDEDAVAAVAKQLRDMNVEAVAIAYMHSYIYPDHERRTRDLLAKLLPGVDVTLSSEVCPEVREYERTSTAAANAYVQPLMAGYLTRLDATLRGLGTSAPIHLITSGGTLTSVETAIRFPIRLVESGPAGGAILAAGIAAERGESQILSFDMGGTTAKICLIEDGIPLKARSFEVDRSARFLKGSGLPVRIPVIEMIEIGAGGGSIASIDGLKRVQVGPRSAGSSPGPACYGRGGEHPTVTDADLVLGRIDAAAFAGGGMPLTPENAETALRTHIGAPLGLAPQAAGSAVSEVVDENMVNAARVHAVERGVDVAGRTLVAFGGAAPLHACRLAQKLGITKVIIPADAGVGSAIGFLEAPAAFEIVRSQFMALDAFDQTAAQSVLDELAHEVTQLAASAAGDAPLTVMRQAYMRYAGQGHEVAVSLPEGALTDAAANVLRAAFEAEYERLFSRQIPHARVEIMSWSVLATDQSTIRPMLAPAASLDDQPNATSTRSIFDPEIGDRTDFTVYQRTELRPGHQISGPCVIAESGTSSIIPSGFELTVDAGGALVVASSVTAARTTARTTGTHSDLTMQIMWNRLIAVVEEQAQVLLRTAFSPIVREAGDLSAGIFDAEGRMLAQAVTGTPGHVNSMAESVKHFIAHFEVAKMQPGDVYITNDPWKGTGHTNDFVVTTPCFRGDKLVGLFSCTSHLMDIGGIGFSPDATDVFMEGLQIPFLKLFDRGEANDTLFEMTRSNTRLPVDTIGDVYSLANCNEIGCTHLVEMMAEFGLDTLDQLADHICERSEAAVRERIAALPNGTWNYEMNADGYETPITLAASTTVDGTNITVDYTGTSPVQPRGVNVPLAYTTAYTVFGLACAISPDVPNNAGSLAPYKVTAPEGSLLNPLKPAAVLVRHVTGQMLPDVVFGCMRQFLPERIPTEGTSCIWNITLRGRFDESDTGNYGFATTFTSNGGTGARPNSDGLSATAFPSGVKGTPVEIAEQILPLIFWRKELRPGSGGAGRTRGGLGQIIEIASRINQPFELLAAFDRIIHPPRGAFGGSNGAPGRAVLASGKTIVGKGTQPIPANDRLIIEISGGGGYGNPNERDPAKVESDRKAGLL